MEKQSFFNTDTTWDEILRAILIGLVIGVGLVYLLGIYKSPTVPCEKCGVLVKRETPNGLPWHYVLHEGVCNRWFWACQKHNHYKVECNELHTLPMCIPTIVAMHREKCGLPSVLEDR